MDIPYIKRTLDNGLDVIVHEHHQLPMVAVNLWYHVGPANEIPGRTGFAHLFEHMMFQGSKHVAADTHFKLLEAAGASDVNGTTNFDRTNYFETVPSNQLELALWMESDRMGFLLDVLDEKALANQRDVVRNERRQSLENRPYGVPDEDTIAAIHLAARTEGMLTDPVYEGKSMAGLIDLVNRGEIGSDSTVLYAHLGGQPALNGYSALFS